MKLKVRSKEKEQKFINHLSDFFKDPEAIIPDCMDKGMFCPFESYKKKLAQAYDTEKYDKFSRSADQFLSGVSETYRIVESNSAPMLGFISTPYGNVEYGKKGNTDPTVLAGIHNYDDEIWRMLAFSSLARSKDIKVYSSRNFYIASCKGHGPDIEFFKDVLEEHDIQYELSENEINIANEGRHFTISHSSGVVINVFENSQGNTLYSILKHFLSKDPVSDFRISSDFMAGCIDSIPNDALVNYFSGKIDNRKFIRKIIDHRINEGTRQGRYMISDTCYDSAEAFLEQFEDDFIDTGILIEPLVSYGKGIYLESNSIRKLLEILWPTSGQDILRSVFPNMDEKTLKSLKGSPIDQIEAGRRSFAIAEVDSLITVKPWSRNSEFLIQLIKDYFKSGKDLAIRNAERSLKSSSGSKSIFYAFLKALNELDNREWLFSSNEEDLGSKMLDSFLRILNKKSEDINREIAEMKPYVP